MAWTTSICNLMQSISGLTMGNLYDKHHDLFLPLFIGTMLCVYSFLCAILLAYFDKKQDEMDGKTKDLIADDEKFKLSDIKKLSIPFWILNIDDIFLMSCFFIYVVNY